MCACVSGALLQCFVFLAVLGLGLAFRPKLESFGEGNRTLITASTAFKVVSMLQELLPLTLPAEP